MTSAVTTRTNTTQTNEASINATHTNTTQINMTQTNKGQSDVHTDNALQDAFPGVFEHYFEPEEEKHENWNRYPVVDHFDFTPEEEEQMTREWSEYNLRLCALSWGDEFVEEQLRRLQS